ncbi:MAG TPA: acyl--CoA ligase [Candidatus Acidoferrum sp.]|nr:acyl--CoA ligase [Candidatus Acidoferrum sp.]
MLREATIAAVLDGGDAALPAVVVPDGPTLTYRRLRELVDEAAARLDAIGVRPGARVAMAFPNGPEAIVFFLAAAGLATACPLNPAYTEAEFRFYLEDTGARFLLVPPSDGAAVRSAFSSNGTLVEGAIDSDGRLQMTDRTMAAPSLRSHAMGEEQAASQDSIALVLHTSGTTSRPKRVPLRHRHLLASVRNVVSSYQLTPDDVSLCVMPLFHVHGLVASVLATLASGGTVVVLRPFTPVSFWPAARSTLPTWFSASPTPHQLILMRTSHNRPPGTERLRFVRSCSAALPISLMNQMEERLGVPVLEAYGMTEASHQMASNPLPPRPRLPGSVGVGTGVEIAILDEAGAVLPRGTTGEVAIRGSNVMDGYENNPQANASAFSSGWFRTGDQGVLDGDEYLRLLGRIKELINRGGEKIAPREIDEALVAHPAVAEAVSFGVPHETWGEVVEAAVVTRQPVTERELQNHCRTLLAEFKIPGRIHIVDAIPKTPTGKVQRRFVAQQFAPS